MTGLWIVLAFVAGGSAGAMVTAAAFLAAAVRATKAKQERLQQLLEGRR